jgi:hypothetical protein
LVTWQFPEQLGKRRQWGPCLEVSMDDSQIGGERSHDLVSREFLSFSEELLVIRAF